MQTVMAPHLLRWSAENKAQGTNLLPDPHGMLTIFTGPGKGKSTAAFGMAWRAIAHNMKIGVVQFVGGSESNAECRLLSQHPQCTFKIFGAGCLWDGQQYAQDKGQMVAAWMEVRRMMADPAYSLIICDEINPVIHDQYLNLDTIKPELTTRRPDLHMVLTGRNALFELLDMADLATDMREFRSPLSTGNLAPQAGIHY